MMGLRSPRQEETQTIQNRVKHRVTRDASELSGALRMVRNRWSRGAREPSGSLVAAEHSDCGGEVTSGFLWHENALRRMLVISRVMAATYEMLLNSPRELGEVRLRRIETEMP